MRAVGLIAFGVAAMAVLPTIGCSSSSGPAKSAAGATSTVGSSVPSVRTIVPSTTATTAATAQNLTVSDDVRAQLVAAGAAAKNLPASAFTGLAPGLTYYALDTTTMTYWAGAKLVPSSASLPAQVSVQDDGAYDIFTKPSSGSWTAKDDGLGGIGGTACVTIPAAVLAVWHWATGTCRPPA